MAYLLNKALLYDFYGIALLRGIMHRTPHGPVSALADFGQHFEIPYILHGLLAVIPGCLALLLLR
jgi:hypothetical protein